MTDPTKPNLPATTASDKKPTTASDKKPMTAADAAKLVRRPVVTRKVTGKDGDGNDVVEASTKLVKVETDEVLDFKDYGTHVVVVTKDGQKFSSADAA